MILYHTTTRESADAILREGFRDRTDYYMTPTLHTGVWLSDQPLDGNTGAKGNVLLRLKLPKRDVVEFEWIDHDHDYREFLVPAVIVNKAKASIEEHDLLTYLGR